MSISEYKTPLKHPFSGHAKHSFLPITLLAFG